MECIYSSNYWKALGHNQAECIDLLVEFPINILNTNNIFYNDENESYIINQDNSNFTSANSDIHIVSESKLDIENIVDLTLPCFSFSNTNFDCEKIRPQSKLTSSKGHGNMNFEVSNMSWELKSIMFSC
ncbi:5502_t:CDS:2 [Scutellospora calospora]|uniref:5502_t:CDS:1 n=1 Tax=Scutellospora calospora TaxID=85575 RepID=A0ACA9K0M7_9GLOM|nr:5502_t:CDS:2 [Scutellospora calospora]